MVDQIIIQQIIPFPATYIREPLPAPLIFVLAK